jgi:hypothetical protein
MKVKIGKNNGYKWYHKWFNLEPKAKVNVKIHSYDTWNMDTTLAHIITPMLYQLKNTKQGSPCVDDVDVPEHLQGDIEINENLIHERWDWVIGEILFAFESKIAEGDWRDQYCTGEHDVYDEPVMSEDGELIGYEMKTGPNDTFKMDLDAVIRHQERITNGFTLFGKYYEGLWT